MNIDSRTADVLAKWANAAADARRRLDEAEAKTGRLRAELLVADQEAKIARQDLDYWASNFAAWGERFAK